MTGNMGLRERKKARTRQSLVDAAITLFASKGYDETTIADVTAAADVSPRTFFVHFASKEDVLLDDSPLKPELFTAVLAHPAPDETPAHLLLRAVHSVLHSDTDLMGQSDRVRADLILQTPALRAGAVRKVLEGQHEIVRALLDAYPDTLDPVAASALVGAMVGTLIGAITMLYSDATVAARLAADPQQMRAELETAITSTWRQIGATG
ncbi:TetR/AcrR family transcriptional regulator [Micromonospora sp. NPDC005203]|uniref:TetR/AcrR family transcriptional regulator n=1 Tax=Micromonospora sp. NPDC005203 TaxID=3364226 RepID=UPI0036A1E5E4